MGVDTNIYADVPGMAPSDDELRRFSVQAQVSLGQSVLWVYQGGTRDRWRHAFSAEQRDGHWRLGVRSIARYYGPGYERGPLVQIISVMKFIAHHWPDAKRYYGPDHSDEAPEWTDETERQLWNHLFSDHGRAYFKHGAGIECDFCLIPTNQCMWGSVGAERGYGSYCPSCNRYWFVNQKGEATETQEDWKIPARPRGALPEVRLKLGRLRAVADSLFEGEHPKAAAIELEHMMEDAEHVR